MKFEDASKEFLQYASKRHKKQGFDTLKQNFIKHIYPYFKKLYLEDLNVDYFISWQDKIYDLNFSNNYNRNIFQSFHSFIKYCLLKQYLKIDFLLLIGPFKKKVEHRVHNIYSKRDYKKFRKGLSNDIYKVFFDLLFFYGLRSGEAMALKFSNLQDNNLVITSSMRRRGTREIESVKSNNSNRVIKLRFSMRLKIANLRNMYINNFGCDKDFFLFGGIKPLSPTSIKRYKHNACLKMGIREITTHEFRHSCASRLVQKGLDINSVSKLLGHSSISITYDIYVHKKREVTSFSNTLKQNFINVLLSIFTHMRKNL